MKMAVLGAGTMAKALVAPMKDFDNKLEIAAYSPSGTKAKQLAEQTKGSVLLDIKNLSSFDLIFLGCMPYHLDSLCKSVGKKLHSKQTIVSILAATPIPLLQKKWGTSSIVRIMPNMPSLANHGVNIVATSKEVIPEHKDYLISTLKSISQTFIVDNDKAIDQITPVSGSGPGLLFMWAQLLENHLKNIGIAPEIGRNIIVHTFLGSAKLMEQSDQSFEGLKESVTSPKGITHEMLEEFKHSHLESIVKRAFSRAEKRSLELGRSRP